MGKEFGSLSREQVRQIYASLYELNQQVLELGQAVAEAENLPDLVTPWADWYELPFSEHIARFLLIMGLGEYLLAAASTDDPKQAFLDTFTPDLADQVDTDSLDEEDKQVITGLVMSIGGQCQALQQFSQPMSMLVDKVRQGDMDSLFRAVWVDRSAVACPTIAKEISLAQMRGDESFLNRLAKALTRTKPARPDPKYNDLRYMLEVVLEGSEPGQLTTTKLEDLLAHDLELYATDGDYSLRAFRKFIQKRHKLVGT
ncbi:hypothetical protein [Marinobacterium litorale]|uniref:hypothetical protein n=1 Tax=Marinobacterium litorale TaxID=404770 RepID=UPI000484EC92|nr:hypothetical protein [Marinobacterium litorale]